MLRKWLVPLRVQDQTFINTVLLVGLTVNLERARVFITTAFWPLFSRYVMIPLTTVWPWPPKYRSGRELRKHCQLLRVCTVGDNHMLIKRAASCVVYLLAKFHYHSCLAAYVPFEARRWNKDLTTLFHLSVWVGLLRHTQESLNASPLRIHSYSAISLCANLKARDIKKLTKSHFMLKIWNN
jgi:hypothetical protein